DPKGGSPRTPSGGIRLSEIPTPPPMPIEIHHNGVGVWKAIAGMLATALAGMTGMYFTARSEQGVKQEEMHAYVQLVTESRNAQQDKDIGSLIGFKDRIFDRLNNLENYNVIDTSEKNEMKQKMKWLGDTLEAEQKAKR